MNEVVHQFWLDGLDGDSVKGAELPGDLFLASVARIRLDEIDPSLPSGLQARHEAVAPTEAGVGLQHHLPEEGGRGGGGDPGATQQPHAQDHGEVDVDGSSFSPLEYSVSNESTWNVCNDYSFQTDKVSAQ